MFAASEISCTSPSLSFVVFKAKSPGSLPLIPGNAKGSARTWTVLGDFKPPCFWSPSVLFKVFLLKAPASVFHSLKPNHLQSLPWLQTSHWSSPGCPPLSFFAVHREVWLRFTPQIHPPAWGLSRAQLSYHWPQWEGCRWDQPSKSGDDAGGTSDMLYTALGWLVRVQRIQLFHKTQIDGARSQQTQGVKNNTGAKPTLWAQHCWE